MGDTLDSKDLSYHVGHRERLRQKLFEGKITEPELLELFLGTIIPRCDVRVLARQLLEKYGGIHQILAASVESLMQNKGIKEKTAVAIKINQAFMIAGLKGNLKDVPIFHDYNKLSDYCKFLLAGKIIEEFHVLYLDADHRLLSDDLHSRGTIDWAAVYPKEILKQAMNLGAHSVVLVHNHPTLNTSFSNPDIDITDKIKDLLKNVDIDVFDHLLVSGSIVYSAKNMFLIK